MPGEQPSVEQIVETIGPLTNTPTQALPAGRERRAQPHPLTPSASVVARRPRAAALRPHRAAACSRSDDPSNPSSVASAAAAARRGAPPAAARPVGARRAPDCGAGCARRRRRSGSPRRAGRSRAAAARGRTQPTHATSNRSSTACVRAVRVLAARPARRAERHLELVAGDAHRARHDQIVVTGSRAAGVHRSSLPPRNFDKLHDMADLKLGYSTGYWSSGPPAGALDAIKEADRLGFDSVWSAEAYGSDALTPLAWWGVAHRARQARHRRSCRCRRARPPRRRWRRSRSTTCAAAASSSASARRARRWSRAGTGGRTRARSSALASTCRSSATSCRREQPVEFHGRHYDMPYIGADGMGIGKPLRSTVHPLRNEIPIYLGAEGPRERVARGRDLRRLAAAVLLPQGRRLVPRPARRGLRRERRPDQGRAVRRGLAWSRSSPATTSSSAPT